MNNQTLIAALEYVAAVEQTHSIFEPLHEEATV